MCNRYLEFKIRYLETLNCLQLESKGIWAYSLVWKYATCFFAIFKQNILEIVFCEQRKVILR